MEFTLQPKRDWSLHRKGPVDQARHNDKVREAIKGNLGDIISEQVIIDADQDTRVPVLVPVKIIELPRFKYADNDKKSEHVGQGDGESSVGDVIGEIPGQAGPGKGKGASDEPGVDYYEAEITIDDLAKLIFADLELPNLQRKQEERIDTETIKYTDIGRKGILPNLDKRRTIIETIKRNAIELQDPTFFGLKPDICVTGLGVGKLPENLMQQ